MMRSIPYTEGQVGISPPKARRSVRVHFLRGTMIEGNLVLSQTRGIAEVLNKPAPFIELETADGRLLHVAKSSIQALEVIDCPRKPKPAH